MENVVKAIFSAIAEDYAQGDEISSYVKLSGKHKEIIEIGFYREDEGALSFTFSTKKGYESVTVDYDREVFLRYSFWKNDNELIKVRADEMLSFVNSFDGGKIPAEEFAKFIKEYISNFEN